MSDRAKAVLTALLDLPADERQFVIDRAGDGTDEDLSQEAWDAAWEVEIKRRVDEIRTGKVTCVPWEDIVRQWDENPR